MVLEEHHVAVQEVHRVEVLDGFQAVAWVEVGIPQMLTKTMIKVVVLAAGAVLEDVQVAAVWVEEARWEDVE